MANIQKRPDERWRARYRDSAGKERAKHFARKVDAQRWLDEVTADVLTGRYVDPRAAWVTFGDFAMEWLASRTTDVSTREATSSRLRNHLLPTFGAMELRAIRASHVQAWLRGRTDAYAPTTVRVLLACLSSILSAAVDDGLLHTNPCAAAQSTARVLSLAPRGSDGVLLGPRQPRARRLRAAPDPLGPPHPHRASERRRVVQEVHPPAVPDRDNSAVRAPRQRLVGLDVDEQPPVLSRGHLQDVESLDTEQSISPRTARDRGPTPRVGHVRAFPSAAWSPLIVEALTLVYSPDTPPASSTSTTLNWEEPVW